MEKNLSEILAKAKTAINNTSSKENLSETIKKAKSLLKEIAYGSIPSQKYTTSATGEYTPPQQAPAVKPVIGKPAVKSTTQKVAPKKNVKKPINRADVLKKQGQIINKGKNIPVKSSGAANAAFKNKIAGQSANIGQGQVEPEQPVAGAPTNFGTAFEGFLKTLKQKPATIEDARAQIELILKKIYKVK